MWEHAIYIIGICDSELGPRNQDQTSSTQTSQQHWVHLPCRPAILNMLTLQASDTEYTYPAGQKYWVRLPCRPEILSTLTLQASNTKCTYPAGQHYQVHLPCRPAILSVLTLQVSNTKYTYTAGLKKSGVHLPCRPAILRWGATLQASNTQEYAYPAGQQYPGVLLVLPCRPATLRRGATLQARNTKRGYPAGWQCSNCANALQISSTQSAAALFVLASNAEQQLPCRPAILSEAALQTSNTKCSYNAVQKYSMQLPCWSAILNAVTLQTSNTEYSYLLANNTECSYPAGQQYWMQLSCRPAILSAVALKTSKTHNAITFRHQIPKYHFWWKFSNLLLWKIFFKAPLWRTQIIWVLYISLFSGVTLPVPRDPGHSWGMTEWMAKDRTASRNFLAVLSADRRLKEVRKQAPQIT